MDDTVDDTRYSPNRYGVNHQQGYVSSRPKYVGEDETDIDDEEDGVEFDEEKENNNQNNHIVPYVGKDVDDDDDEVEDHGSDDEYNEDDDDWKADDVDDVGMHPKKRKLKGLVSNYEFAPRVPTPVGAPPAPRPSSGGRNSLTDWNEHETFVLLEAWGDRFLQRGRKSLRSEEWQEVAEKVSEVSKIERTETQCRNRVDTLKKKYKKEKLRMAEAGDTRSKWVYFKKLTMLMTSPQQQSELSHGMDSGEYVFMNPRAYLNRSNGVDAVRDSTAHSESTAGDEGQDSDGLPPKKRKIGRESDVDRSSFRLLADAIHKFSEIYEKIENGKRRQIVELEKMRMEFHRGLEMQRNQIMERAKAEIMKIWQGLDDENDTSAENASG